MSRTEVLAVMPKGIDCSFLDFCVCLSVVPEVSSRTLFLCNCAAWAYVNLHIIKLIWRRAHSILTNMMINHISDQKASGTVRNHLVKKYEVRSTILVKAKDCRVACLCPKQIMKQQLHLTMRFMATNSVHAGIECWTQLWPDSHRNWYQYLRASNGQSSQTAVNKQPNIMLSHKSKQG